MSNDNSPTANTIADQIARERTQRTAALGFDLLPCPFCGAAPYVEHDEEFAADYIACDCGAYYAGADLAGWNSRVAMPDRSRSH